MAESEAAVDPARGAKATGTAAAAGGAGDASGAATPVSGGSGLAGGTAGPPVLRRKAAAARPQAAPPATPARAFRLALSRAGQEVPGLDLTVEALTETRRSLAELLDLPVPQALLAIVEGPGEALGLAMFDPAVLAGLVEVLTTGRAGTGAPPVRRPTRTDAAMAAVQIDRTLQGFGAELAQGAEAAWSGGWRYASFLEDPRPLGLLLEEGSYRCFTAEVALAGGARRGTVLMALPAEARGPSPVGAADATRSGPEGAATAQPPGPVFAEAAMSFPAELSAVLCRLRLPLADVLSLRPGEELPLREAALDRIGLEGLDGRAVAIGRLGQHRGHRALRLVAGPGVEEGATATGEEED